MPVVLGNPRGSLGTSGFRDAAQILMQLASQRRQATAQKRDIAARQQAQLLNLVAQGVIQERQLTAMNERERERLAAYVERERMRGEQARDELYMKTIGMPHKMAAAEADRLGLPGGAQEFWTIATDQHELYSLGYTDEQRRELRGLMHAEHAILTQPEFGGGIPVGPEDLPVDQDAKMDLNYIRQRRAGIRRGLVDRKREPTAKERIMKLMVPATELPVPPQGAWVVQAGRYSDQGRFIEPPANKAAEAAAKEMAALRKQQDKERDALWEEAKTDLGATGETYTMADVARRTGELKQEKERVTDFLRWWEQATPDERAQASRDMADTRAREERKQKYNKAVERAEELTNKEESGEKLTPEETQELADAVATINQWRGSVEALGELLGEYGSRQ